MVGIFSMLPLAGVGGAAVVAVVAKVTVCSGVRVVV
jgi:hypothetical protein